MELMSFAFIGHRAGERLRLLLLDCLSVIADIMQQACL